MNISFLFILAFFKHKYSFAPYNVIDYDDNDDGNDDYDDAATDDDGCI